MSEATTTDLVAFITARLDEDEAIAGASRTWNAEGREIVGPVYAGCSYEMQIYDEGGHDELDAAHIALHDPARSLREVQILREVTADLSVLAGLSLGPGPEMARLMLRKISGIWSDHPDYRTWLPVLTPGVPRQLPAVEMEADPESGPAPVPAIRRLRRLTLGSRGTSRRGGCRDLKRRTEVD